MTATELEVSPHDDTDIYDDNLQLEQGEEEPLTEDEFMDVQAHDDDDDDDDASAPEGNPVDAADTLPNGMESEDEHKGAHKVGHGTRRKEDREGTQGYCTGVSVSLFMILVICSVWRIDRLSKHPVG